MKARGRSRRAGGGVRGRVFRPLPLTLRIPSRLKLRLPPTGPEARIGIGEGKKRIRTLFVLLYKRSGWCNGRSAHTCKTRTHWLNEGSTADAQLATCHTLSCAPSTGEGRRTSRTKKITWAKPRQTKSSFSQQAIENPKMQLTNEF